MEAREETSDPQAERSEQRAEGSEHSGERTEAGEGSDQRADRGDRSPSGGDSSNGRVDAREEIEALVGFEGRAPGTDAERQAAEHLAKRLRALGRDAELEPIRVRPNWSAAHAIHALLAVVASVVSVFIPIIGVVLALLVATSLVLDLTGTFYLARLLTGRRASQNVVSPEESERPGRLILVAHYDAGRAGAPYQRRLVERHATLSKRIRRPIGPFQPLVYSIFAVFICTVLRLFNHSPILAFIQLIPTAILIGMVPILADIALSRVIVPGATDNASGVATALRLAERYGGKLEHFDVWVLLPGAGEGLMLGMRQWMRAHRRELDPSSTIFINLDQVGSGTVRFVTEEGYVFTYPYHPTLVETCQEIAEADEEENRFGARALKSRSASDAHVARTAGFPAITISCLNAMDYNPNSHQDTDTPDRVEEDALERAYGFCAQLIERVDHNVGRDLRETVKPSVLVE